QRSHFTNSQPREPVSLNLLEARPAIRFVGAEFFLHTRQRPSHRPPAPLWHFRFHPLIIVGLDYVHNPMALQVPVIYLPPMFPARSIFAVQSPVARNAVHFPVPIQIPHVHSLPPPHLPLQTQFLRHFLELPSPTATPADRPP